MLSHKLLHPSFLTDYSGPMLSYTSWERIGDGEDCDIDGSSIHCTENTVSPDYWPYTVQPYPIDFTQHPMGTITSATYWTLICSISSPLVNCSDLFQPSFHWELNGTLISTSSNVFTVEGNATSSWLIVDMKSENETEGVYTCFVEDHYFSLQSLPAQVQNSSKFTNRFWFLIRQNIMC